MKKLFHKIKEEMNLISHVLVSIAFLLIFVVLMVSTWSCGIKYNKQERQIKEFLEKHKPSTDNSYKMLREKQIKQK